MGVVAALRLGSESDDFGRWALREVIDVRQRRMCGPVQKGRRRRSWLEALVRWEGDWPDSWCDARGLTRDVQATARAMGARAGLLRGVLKRRTVVAAPSAGRRRSPRLLEAQPPMAGPSCLHDSGSEGEESADESLSD